MIALYGPNNGFDWKENDVIAAQIVSVPATLPAQMANREFHHLMGSLIAVGAVTLLVLNFVLVLTVIRPVSRLANKAPIKSAKAKWTCPSVAGQRQKMKSPVLAAAFNRMHRSLVNAAMKMLDKH